MEKTTGTISSPATSLSDLTGQIRGAERQATASQKLDSSPKLLTPGLSLSTHHDGHIRPFYQPSTPQSSPLGSQLDMFPDDSEPAKETKLVLNKLLNNKSTPADLLVSLAARACTADSPIRNIHQLESRRQLAHQLRGIGGMEAGLVRNRLQGRQIEALRTVLREGVGGIDVNNRALLDDVNSQIDAQLGEMQRVFKCIPPRKPPTKIEIAQARKMLDGFNRLLDKHCVSGRRTFSGAQLTQMVSKFENNALGEDALSLNKPHELYPRVSELMLKDSDRGCYILQHSNGEAEWLVDDSIKDNDEKKAQTAAKFEKFCGDKSLTISQIACQTIPLLLYIDRIVKEADLPMHHFADGEKLERYAQISNPMAYFIKDCGDGSFEINFEMNNTLSNVAGGSDFAELNMNLSHWNARYGIRIGADGTASFTGMTCDYSAVPNMTGEPTESANCFWNNNKPLHQALHDKYWRNACPGQQPQYNFAKLDNSKTNDYCAELLGQNAQFDKTGKASFATDVTELNERGILAREDLDFLTAAPQFLAGAAAGIEKLQQANAANLQDAVAEATELADDLRLIQQNLSRNAEQWAGGMGGGDKQTAINLAAGISAACEVMRAELNTLTADRNAAMDSFNGGIHQAAASSRLNRTELAAMQSGAMLSALKLIQFELGGDEGATNEKISRLVREVEERSSKWSENLAACRDGLADPLAAGPGADGARFFRYSGEIVRGLQKGGSLPDAHSHLSEAQLIMLKVGELARDDPEIAKLFRNLTQIYSIQFTDHLSRDGDWKQIVSTFQDFGSEGKLRNVTSTITPAKSFAEAAFAASQDNAGVPSCARTQGAHVCNLAHSSFSNEKGEMMFAALRHGVLDAYDITEAKLRSLPNYFKNRLKSQIQENRGHLNLNDAGTQRATANENMARELVRAAVAGNPHLLGRALDGKEVRVSIDSLSLSSPEMTRPFSGRERRMLENQNRALNSLDNEMTITIAGDAGPVQVNVMVDKVRNFNFSVGESRLTALLRKIIPPFLGWNKADRMNNSLLWEMIGPLDRPEPGGEAAKVLSYLDGDDPQDLSEQQREALQLSGGMPSAFAEPGKRAEMIRLLSAQIKQISAQRSHHSSGKEPYQLAARVALLSNLLGRTTTMNCKSGNDRSAQLDEAVKMLSADLEAGVVPAPGAGLNPLRSTNYALRTCNLELQQYSTGMRGHMLHGRGGPRVQLSSQTAEELFYGNARQARA